MFRDHSCHWAASFAKAFCTAAITASWLSATVPDFVSMMNRALPSSWPGMTWFTIIGHAADIASCTVAPPALLMTR